MHDAAREFVAAAVERHGSFASVIEIGSRDVNGTIRGLFSGARYTGLDLHEGPAVDWIGDAAEYQPAARVECVVCCEVLEHADNWRELVAVAGRWLAPFGYLIVTCAGPGRKPHSAIDGEFRLHPGEHYANVSVEDLADAFNEAGLQPLTLQKVGRDTQAVAVA